MQIGKKLFLIAFPHFENQNDILEVWANPSGLVQRCSQSFELAAPV